MPDDGPLSTQLTPWTLILSAQGPEADPVLRRECLATLYILYHKPILKFFRRLGFADPDDLTQDLFLRILEKNLIDYPDRERGRFRSWLKTVARNVARDVWRAHAKQRPPPDPEQPPPVDHDGPEAEFDRLWARETLDAALAAFQRECGEEGLAHWVAIFQLRTLPLPAEVRRPSTEEVAAQQGMTVKQVENVVARANARFREHVRLAVRRTVNHDSEVDAEMADLRRLLSG